MGGVDALRFAFFLLQNGSLSGKAIDYDQARIRSLQGIPREIFDAELFTDKNAYEKFRSKLLGIPVVRTLVGNLAFLKDPDHAYRQYYISHRQRLVYVRILKCGSTSVLKSFLPLVHDPLLNYPLEARQIDSLAHYLASRALPQTAEGYTFFSVTRNPLERLVSAYLDLFSNPSNFPEHLFGVFKHCNTFKRLVKALSSIPDKLRGPHFVSQSRILDQLKNKKILTYKLNPLAEDPKLTTFLQEYNLQLSVQNQSDTRYDYKDYYDTETLELACSIYERDFMTLGYDRDFKNLKNCQ